MMRIWELGQRLGLGGEGIVSVIGASRVGYRMINRIICRCLTFLSIESLKSVPFFDSTTFYSVIASESLCIFRWATIHTFTLFHSLFLQCTYGYIYSQAYVMNTEHLNYCSKYTMVIRLLVAEHRALVETGEQDGMGEHEIY